MKFKTGDIIQYTQEYLNHKAHFSSYEHIQCASKDRWKILATRLDILNGSEYLLSYCNKDAHPHWMGSKWIDMDFCLAVDEVVDKHVHTPIDVGFRHSKMVCKTCNCDLPNVS